MADLEEIPMRERNRPTDEGKDDETGEGSGTGETGFTDADRERLKKLRGDDEKNGEKNRGRVNPAFDSTDVNFPKTADELETELLRGCLPKNRPLDILSKNKTYLKLFGHEG